MNEDEIYQLINKCKNQAISKKKALDCAKKLLKRMDQSLTAHVLDAIGEMFLETGEMDILKNLEPFLDESKYPLCLNAIDVIGMVFRNTRSKDAFEKLSTLMESGNDVIARRTFQSLSMVFEFEHEIKQVKKNPFWFCQEINICNEEGPIWRIINSLPDEQNSKSTAISFVLPFLLCSDSNMRKGCMTLLKQSFNQSNREQIEQVVNGLKAIILSGPDLVWREGYSPYLYTGHNSVAKLIQNELSNWQIIETLFYASNNPVALDLLNVVTSKIHDRTPFEASSLNILMILGEAVKKIFQTVDDEELVSIISDFITKGNETFSTILTLGMADALEAKGIEKAFQYFGFRLRNLNQKNDRLRYWSSLIALGHIFRKSGHRGVLDLLKPLLTPQNDFVIIAITVLSDVFGGTNNHEVIELVRGLMYDSRITEYCRSAIESIKS